MIEQIKSWNRELKIGAFIMGLYFLWAIIWFVYSHFIAGTIVNPYIPSSSIEFELLSPGNEFLFGSDIYGRSMLEVLSQGLVYSLSVSFTVSFLSALIGVVVGYMTVEGPNSVKYISDLLTNLIFIFPSILIAIMVMAVTGQSVPGLVLTLVFTGWPAYARIARGETQRVMGLSYVESARAIGVGEYHLFLKTVIPSILPVLIVNIVLGVGGVVISEAALGFLGLGGSEYSWGSLLSMGKTVLLEAPFIVILLSVTLGGLIIGLNLLGDGLRDQIDPRKSF